jgi:hypothetical protein
MQGTTYVAPGLKSKFCAGSKPAQNDACPPRQRLMKSLPLALHETPTMKALRINIAEQTRDGIDRCPMTPEEGVLTLHKILVCHD